MNLSLGVLEFVHESSPRVLEVGSLFKIKTMHHFERMTYSKGLQKSFEEAAKNEKLSIEAGNLLASTYITSPSVGHLNNF